MPSTVFKYKRKFINHQIVCLLPQRTSFLVIEPQSVSSMPPSVRLIAKPRPGGPYVCVSCRWRTTTTASHHPQLQQKRWITRNHIRRIKDAMTDWEERADATLKGKKQSMLSLLEERGFVHQIIGSAESYVYNRAALTEA